MTQELNFTVTFFTLVIVGIGVYFFILKGTFQRTAEKDAGATVHSPV
jgi:hypothetical protein